MLSLLLYAFFLSLFELVPSARDLVEGLHPTLAFIIQYLIQFVVLFFPLWIFIVDKYGAGLTDFGFQKVPIGRLIGTVFLAYLFYIVVSFLISTLLFSTELEVPGYKEQASYIPLFGADPIGFTAALLFIIIVAPFLEELFFRGFIYRVFVKTWPVWLGSVLTATLFALIHFQINSFFPLFLLGLILNFVYHRTGSVWTSVAFHSLNNTVAFGLDIYLYFHPELLAALIG